MWAPVVSDTFSCTDVKSCSPNEAFSLSFQVDCRTQIWRNVFAQLVFELTTCCCAVVCGVDDETRTLKIRCAGTSIRRAARSRLGSVAKELVSSCVTRTPARITHLVRPARSTSSAYARRYLANTAQRSLKGPRLLKRAHCSSVCR